MLLTAEVTEERGAPFQKRVAVTMLGHGCWRINVRYGFRNDPDIAHVLEIAGALGLEFDTMTIQFFLSRESLVPVGLGGSMALWRKRRFAMMARNTGNTADYFELPTRNRKINPGPPCTKPC